jgi:hypothetical protein
MVNMVPKMYTHDINTNMIPVENISEIGVGGGDKGERWRG